MTPTPYINFKRERRFGDKINATFAFVSMNMKPVAKNALFIAGPFALLTAIVLQVYQYQTFSSMPQTVTGPIAIEDGGIFSSSAWLAYFGITYLILFVMLALVVAITQRHIRAYVETGSAEIETVYLLQTLWRDMLSALGTTIGIGVLLGVLFAFLMLPFGLLVAALPSAVTAILMVLGIFLLMLLLSSVLMLVYPIRNFERLNFFEALARAFRLNTEKWWSTAGLVLVTFLIQFALTMALYIPMYAVVFLRGFHMDDPAAMIAQNAEFGWFSIFSALASVVYAVGFTVVGSIMLVALSFQYFNLRERREASGLLERIQSFGVAPQVSEDEEQY